MTKNDTYNIICFSYMPWSNMWKRNQSMMAEIAKCSFINKVIFINPSISVRSIFKTKNKNGITSNNFAAKLSPQKISSKIMLYTPVHIFPLKHRSKLLKKLDDHFILAIIKRLNAKIPYILFMNNPDIFSHDCLDNLLESADLSIFDFSDDFVELISKNSIELKKKCLSNISKYASNADMVLTVNEHLKNKYSYLNRRIHVLRNSTNYTNFHRKRYQSIEFMEKIKNTRQPILGYTGWVNKIRIDDVLLDYFLEKQPNWQYVFIGPADSYFLEKYSQFKNFHHLPPVDYQDLPNYINYFDVAIVPFKINEHTRGNDLLKFHDYLAMGKPIVSTDIGGAKDLKHVIRIAQSPVEFLDQAEKALKENTTADLLNRNKEALQNSWPNRIIEFEHLLSECFKTTSPLSAN